MSALFQVIVGVALLVFLFGLPLRPVAWGGPSGAGPFEEGRESRAGRWSRDVRLPLARFAEFRSPDQPLAATAETLAGFHALLAAARFGVLWFVLRRLGGRGALAAIGVAAAALPLAFAAPRQDEADVGLLLFVIVVAVTTGSPVRRWALVALPALFAFWANAHASAVVGLAWLAVLTAGRAVEWWRSAPDGETNRRAVGRLVLALGLCAAAACLNPDGPRLFADAFRATKNPNIASLPDWQPIDFNKPAGMPWAYFTTLAVLFVAQLLAPRVLGPGPMFILLTFGFWPLVQQRGSAYWFLIAPCLTVPLVASALANLTASRPEATDAEPTPRWRWVAAGVLVVSLLTTPAMRWLVTGRPRSIEDVVEADTPWRVALELTAERDEAGRFLPQLRTITQTSYPGGRYRGAILCGDAQGDFLAWVLDEDNTRPVMTYTRPEALGQPHWAETHRALEGHGDWWEILGRHQVNLVAIDPGQWLKLADRLRTSPDWLVVQDDGPGGILAAVRRLPKLPIEP
ncbi:MAG TPA: hypothetical protein VKE40_13455 [Gemmataceae bacterium]|nr:hypothetical protein [Gemmataceae bacterium]